MESQATVERWRSRLDEGSWGGHYQTLVRFLNWLREGESKFSTMSPGELIEYQKTCDNGSRYEILDVVQDYVQGVNARHSSKSKYYSTLRSFFKHNRAELPNDPFNIRSNIPKVVGTLEIEEIRNLVLSSKPVYQAIILSMFQSGMGQDEFQYWNLNGWEKLKEDLKGEPDIIRADLPGRKKAKNRQPYFTFIGSDAIKAIRDYLEAREVKEQEKEKKALKNGNPYTKPVYEGIFTDQFNNPISKAALDMYWRRKCRTIGLITPRKGSGSGARHGKNLHEMRDVFRTQWGMSTAKPAVAEYLMGHFSKVDPLGYDKTYKNEAFMRGEYGKALRMLQIMSDPKAFGQVDEDRVKELEAEVERLKVGRDLEVEELRQDIEDLKRLFYEKFKEETT